MISFDKIVKKMCEKSGNIITIDDIQRAYFVMTEKGRGQAYKLILRLKSLRILTLIRNGVYFVSAGKPTNMIDIIDENYWKIVRAIIASENVGADYFVAGTTPLLYHIKSFDSPTELLIYTRDTRKTVKIAKNYTIRFTTVASGKGLGGMNAFSRLARYTQKQPIEGILFAIPGRELAILEALSHGQIDAEKRLIVERFLAKFGDLLDRQLLGELVNIRYISAVNRLRELSRELAMLTLHRTCVDSITREGRGCFLTVKTASK